VTQTSGRFQLAHGGTLFLDEIGDLPLELQPKLLRVLQESEFERLGSPRTIRVDVRVVAATHQDLSRMVEERRYRADLFYRLNVFPISIPPLRDRANDIPALVRHFVQHFALFLPLARQYPRTPEHSGTFGVVEPDRHIASTRRVQLSGTRATIFTIPHPRGNGTPVHMRGPPKNELGDRRKCGRRGSAGYTAYDADRTDAQAWYHS
jgi:hypothetical protein